MKEKEDKLRLVKQILVDNNGINPAIALSKEQVPELTTRVISPDRDTRISRKVFYYAQLLLPLKYLYYLNLKICVCVKVGEK